MEGKIARVNWKRGQYSDVFRSSIIDPSPLKAGQKVQVLWGTKTKKELTAVVSVYPVVEKDAITEDVLPSRRTQAKRKLIPESPPAKIAKKTKTKASKETCKEKKKEKPKGKIILAASPVKSIEQIPSSDESDSDDDNPLSPLSLSTAVHPTEVMSDFLDGELELEELGTCNQDLLSKAINTVDVITNRK